MLSTTGQLIRSLISGRQGNPTTQSFGDMEDNILKSVKQTLGVQTDDDSFDMDLSIYISSALSTLKQLGVTFLTNSTSITTGNETWTGLFGIAADTGKIAAYVVLKTGMLFDPPTTSFALEAKKLVAAELADRIYFDYLPPVVTTTQTTEE